LKFGTVDIICPLTFKNEGMLQLYCPEIFGHPSLQIINKNYPLLTDGENLYIIGKRLISEKLDIAEPSKESIQPLKQEVEQQIQPSIQVVPQKLPSEPFFSAILKQDEFIDPLNQQAIPKVFSKPIAQAENRASDIFAELASQREGLQINEFDHPHHFMELLVPNEECQPKEDIGVKI
jgi:hypothetical protein